MLRPIWRRLRDRPLQLRLTLLSTAGVALVVILTSVAGYVALSVSLTHTSQRLALTVAEALVGPAAADIAATGGLTDRVAQVGNVVVEAVDTDGNVLRTPGEQRHLVLQAGDRAAAGPQGRTVRRTGVSTAGDRYVIVGRPVPGSRYALLVARGREPLDDILAVQRTILLGVGLAGVIAAGVIGGLVAWGGLRPVRQLTEAVEHVRRTQDFHPVSVRYARGDLATLAASFNLMLLALGRVREQQTRQVAAAGHDLRTPLTSLRTNVDLMRRDLDRDELSREHRGAILDSVSGQLTELGDLVGDFVHVLRDSSATLSVLDFRDVVTSAVQRVRRRAHGLVFDVDLDPLYLVGNADELERAVTNLLDNALKWSPPGGVIRVRLQGNRFRVSDSGPGIPESDLPYVFDRYFRGESGRTVHGTGLGLSIVAKTIHELGGRVAAGRSADGGAELTLQLPGAASRESVSNVLIPTAADADGVSAKRMGVTRTEVRLPGDAGRPAAASTTH